jgi:hypothetical protein
MVFHHLFFYPVSFEEINEHGDDHLLVNDIATIFYNSGSICRELYHNLNRYPCSNIFMAVNYI